MACANAYCEDDLPEGARILDDGCERMEKFGYSIKSGIYVLCSKQCENVAKQEFGWKLATRDTMPCPKPIDLSSFFGGQVDDSLEQNSSESMLVEGKRKRNAVNYSEFKSDMTKPKKPYAATAQQRPPAVPSLGVSLPVTRPAFASTATLQTTLNFPSQNTTKSFNYP